MQSALTLGLSLACLCYAQAAERVRLMVQTGYMAAHHLAVSSDGRYLLAGGDDVMLWDVATGRLLRRFEGLSFIHGLAFSPDGRLAIAAGNDVAARIWDVASGKEVYRLGAQSEPGSVILEGGPQNVAFSADGREAIVASRNAIEFWDVAAGRQIRRIERPHGNARLSPDGRMALLGGTSFLDLETGKDRGRIYTTFTVMSSCFSRDGTLLLIGGTGEAELWDVTKELRLLHLKWTPQIGDPLAVNAVAISPDGRQALIASMIDGVRLWDLATGRELRHFRDDADSVAFSPDGRRAFAGAIETKVYDLGTANELRRLRGYSFGVDAVAFSPDGRMLLAMDAVKGLRLWDLDSGRESPSGIIGGKLLPDGRLLRIDKDVSTRKLPPWAHDVRLQGWDGHGKWAAALSPDGSLALTAITDDHAVTVWDTASGLPLHKMTGHSGAVEALAFSPDSRLALSTGRDGAAILWDLAAGKERRRLETPAGMEGAAFSPDGRLVISGTGDGHSAISDVATGRAIWNLNTPTGPTAAAFSPDGRLAIVGTFIGASIWDVSTGRELRPLIGHVGTVQGAAFSPDSRLAATAGVDGTVRLWDVATASNLATLVSFSDGTWAVTDPEGLYDAADPDSGVGMHWVAGNDVIELGQLKHRFYVPDLLARIVKRETLPAVAGIQSIPAPPQVQLGSIAGGGRTLTATLADRGGGIGQVVVRANGREIPAKVNGKNVTIQLDKVVQRPDGRNTIEVTAFDAQGLIASRGVSIPWETDSFQADPRIYAIVAGASDYAAPALHLNFAAKDATDIARALRLAAEGLVGRDKTDVRLFATGSAQPPTKDNLRRAFANIAAKAQPGDVFIAYFAGHGITLSNVADRYFYLTPDARFTSLPFNDKAMLGLMSVSSEELREWCLRIPALKQVIILDTCAAGAAGSDLAQLAFKRDLTPDQRRALELLKDSTGSHILMGAAADAASYEAGRYGQGLLTYALLSGMRGAALDEGGRVEVRRWFDFAQRDVEELARGIGGIQRPQVSSPQGSSFPVGLLTAERRAEIPLAKAKQQLLRVQCLDQDDKDLLKLEPALRAALREASAPAARGGPASDPAIVYFDTVVDEVPDALAPQVRYSIEGGSVKARLRLNRSDKTVWEQTITVPSADPAAVAKAIVDVLIPASKDR